MISVAFINSLVGLQSLSYSLTIKSSESNIFEDKKTHVWMIHVYCEVIRRFVTTLNVIRRESSRFGYTHTGHNGSQRGERHCNLDR